MVNGIYQSEDGCRNLTDPRHTIPFGSFINEDDPGYGVAFAFPSVTNKAIGKTYNFDVVLNCAPAVATENIIWGAIYEDIDDKHSKVTVTGAGSAGCPWSMIGNYSYFMEHNKYFIGIVYVFIGLFLLIKGKAMLK